MALLHRRLWLLGGWGDLVSKLFDLDSWGYYMNSKGLRTYLPMLPYALFVTTSAHHLGVSPH